MRLQSHYLLSAYVQTCIWQRSQSIDQKTSVLSSFLFHLELTRACFSEAGFLVLSLNSLCFAARGTATSCSILNPHVGLPNAADAESLILIPSQINVLQAKKKFEILDAVRALCFLWLLSVTQWKAALSISGCMGQHTNSSVCPGDSVCLGLLGGCRYANERGDWRPRAVLHSPDPEGALRGEGCCSQCFVLKTGVTWQCVRICERKKEEKRERHVVNKLVWESVRAVPWGDVLCGKSGLRTPHAVLFQPCFYFSPQMLSFMHAQYTFFQQGYSLLHELDPYMKKLATEVRDRESDSICPFTPFCPERMSLFPFSCW